MKNNKFKKIQTLLWVTFITVSYPFALMIYTYCKSYDLVQEGSTVFDYGIVFGAAVLKNGTPLKVLQNRLDDAYFLYKKGVILKILLTGSLYSQYKYGEPIAMKKYLIKRGVLPTDIILDKDGDNTLLSLLNLKRKINQDSHSYKFLMISSFFHLPRIQHTAFLLGIKQMTIYTTKLSGWKGFFTYKYSILRELISFFPYLMFTFIYHFNEYLFIHFPMYLGYQE